MPMHCLTLFGTPSLQCVGGEATPSPLGAKAIALLAYLTLEQRPQSREKLASLLWGESSDTQARASLRQALRRLHAVLGESLTADRTSVHLAGPLDSDVTRFLKLASQNDPAATEFEVGRFLEGLSMTGAPGLEEWADATRRSLLDRWIGLVRAQARDAVQRSRWRDALRIGESWLAADPLNEEAIAVVMEAMHCLGDRAGALSRYRHYRETLRRELGARPTATLTELVGRIEHAPSPVSNGEAALTGSLPRLEPDLVGRERQWRQLTLAWEGAGQGRSRVTVLEGQAGTGKTRLADEFSRWATGRGATVLQGHGYATTSGAAFGPLAAALASGLNASGLGGAPPEWLAEVARLVPDLRRRFPGMPAPTDARMGEQSRLFEGVAQVCLALAAEHPLIMWLDDLQWFDAESCAMLLYLTERLAQAPVLFLASTTAGSRRRNLPADHLLRQLSARGQATFIELGPLSEDEVWTALRQMGNIRTPTGGRRFAHRIHEVTGGNPFYLIELLKTLFSQGLLSVAPLSGEWIVRADTLAGGMTLPMPRSLRDAIGERVSQLDEETHLLLASLAVAQKPVTPDVLAHIHGISRLRIATMADDLAERSLAAEEDGAYRVAHPMLGDVVRQALTDSLRRELHRALALSIEVVTPPGQLGSAAGEIAWHAEHAGDAERAHEFALLAADDAVTRTAFKEAFGWLAVAARSAPDEADTLAARADALAQRAGWEVVPAFPGPLPPGFAIDEADMDLQPAVPAT